MPAFVVAEPLIFSTSNASPFSSEHNPQAGYVNEIIRRAFASKSISTRFEHYPHTRAVFMATHGKTAGVFPLRSNQAHKDSLYYSNPIPGTKIGYLVPVATQVDTILPVKNGDINAHFLRLGLTRIGYITGAPIPQALVDASNIDTIAVSSVSSLLDMLALDRVDMIFADEYLVKETLVNERPHLQGQYRFIEALSRDHPFFLAVSKDTPNAANIIESFDEAYHALEARGEIEEVLKQYGMYEAAPSSSSLTVGVPDINGIKQVIQYLSSHDTPFSQLAIDWRVMDETVLRKRLQG
ncbi:MAG TPA: ABC transporter substrate-binding protein, partial [Cytophagales bacterium]|nr:ABC transporter substrate-binding protein [Cytophagales bacterium]